MRTIEVTSQCKRDFKRETKGLHRDTLQQDLPKIIQRLASESLLPPTTISITRSQANGKIIESVT